MPQTESAAVLRAPAEQVHAEEIARLREKDCGPRPQGWRLSPRAVRSFILGDDKLGVRRKFYGDDALIDRCIVTLMSDRGLLLVGELCELFGPPLRLAFQDARGDLTKLGSLPLPGEQFHRTFLKP